MNDSRKRRAIETFQMTVGALMARLSGLRETFASPKSRIFA
jgi:hypothetical protein